MVDSLRTARRGLDRARQHDALVGADGVFLDSVAVAVAWGDQASGRSLRRLKAGINRGWVTTCWGAADPTVRRRVQPPHPGTSPRSLGAANGLPAVGRARNAPAPQRERRSPGRTHGTSSGRERSVGRRILVADGTSTPGDVNDCVARHRDSGAGSEAQLLRLAAGPVCRQRRSSTWCPGAIPGVRPEPTRLRRAPWRWVRGGDVRPTPRARCALRSTPLPCRRWEPVLRTGSHRQLVARS